ncbi:hypothetical protein [Methanofollis ethanolicus]|uniref:hypothetical protein n=1 Tax=Methanofollis ethanolicus TaxID=488124 RepID=UPI000835EE49|nr:hypothetical protein [Methanofollis ethanolicus]
MSGQAALLKRIASIAGDATLSEAKKLKEIADVAKIESAVVDTGVNTRAAILNIGKWGAIPAVAGVGGAVGLAAMGASVDSAMGTTEKNASKIGGWLLLLGIVAVVVIAFLPRIKDFMR